MLAGQKVWFPFSVISEKPPKGWFAGETSEDINLIEPGLVNMYMVAYNEWKYQNRNKATRHKFDLEVFRPEIIDLVIDARARLEKPKRPPFIRRLEVEGKAKEWQIYTGDSIAGMGKNFMTEDGRQNGMLKYSKIIQRYALRGLKREIEDVIQRTGGKVSWERILEGLITNSGPRWIHEKKVLKEQLNIDVAVLKPADIIKYMKDLQGVEEDFYTAVYAARQSDWLKGTMTIDDYPDVHKPPSEDKFLVKTLKPALDKYVSEIGAIQQAMGHLPAPSGQQTAPSDSEAALQAV